MPSSPPDTTSPETPKKVNLALQGGGDSDSTGSITGNILGTLIGLDAIPEKYLADLELLPLIQEMAQDLFERMPDAA
jgi:ADP-ribosylglycohydrolase